MQTTTSLFDPGWVRPVDTIHRFLSLCPMRTVPEIVVGTGLKAPVVRHTLSKNKQLFRRRRVRYYRNGEPRVRYATCRPPPPLLPQVREAHTIRQIVYSYVPHRTESNTGDIHKRVVEEYGDLEKRTTLAHLNRMAELGLVTRTQPERLNGAGYRWRKNATHTSTSTGRSVL